MALKRPIHRYCPDCGQQIVFDHSHGRWVNRQKCSCPKPPGPPSPPFEFNERTMTLIGCDRDRSGWPRGVCIGATMNGSWPAIVFGRYRRAFYTTNTGREIVVKALYA